MAKRKRKKATSPRDNTTTPANTNQTITRQTITRQTITRTFRAGCQRTMVLETDLSDIAYRALEYPECPSCPHRVEPEDAAPFCVWRDENTPHPFAGLAALTLIDEPE